MFRLPELPYAYEALSPVISAETLHFHHDKHHAKYVEVMNQLLQEQNAPPRSLEQVVRDAAAGGEEKLYNNAAQTWNHAFFWDSMAPGASQPTERTREAATGAFGEWDVFRARFVQEGADHFASGWAWIVARGEAVEIVSTHDAGSFDQFEGAVPLLVCDVWEHAYYLDHQNDRKGFLEQWFDEIANWGLADRQLAAARGEGQAWRFPDRAG
jgi:Fe-Mn family superoxide dismutase